MRNTFKVICADNCYKTRINVTQIKIEKQIYIISIIIYNGKERIKEENCENWEN